MRIAYPVRIEREDVYFLAQGVAPLAGVITDGDTLEEAKWNAAEALTGVLGAMLDNGMEIPDPPRLAPRGKNVYWIEPDPKVGIPILIKKARLEAGMSLEELARRAGVPYQSVQRWERSGTNPTMSSLVKIFRALGKRIELSVA